MITTKLYEDQEGNLVAVVLEDGQYTNYISSPEVVAFEGDSFIEDARMGFPDAFPCVSFKTGLFSCLTSSMLRISNPPF